MATVQNVVIKMYSHWQYLSSAELHCHYIRYYNSKSTYTESQQGFVRNYLPYKTQLFHVLAL